MPNQLKVTARPLSTTKSVEVKHPTANSWHDVITSAVLQDGSTGFMATIPNVPAGTYTSLLFRLKNSNPAITATWTGSVTVTDGGGTTPGPNQAPTANAGADNSITLPTSAIVLQGSGTDTDGSITGWAWDQVSGPKTAAFSSKAVQRPTASGMTTAGDYVFSVVAIDNQGTRSAPDLVKITVNPASTVENVSDFVFFSRTNNSNNTADTWHNQVQGSSVPAIYGAPGRVPVLDAGASYPSRKAYRLYTASYFLLPEFMTGVANTFMALVDTADAAFARILLNTSGATYQLYTCKDAFALIYDGTYKGDPDPAQGFFLITLRNNGNGTGQAWVNDVKIYDGPLAPKPISGGKLGIGDGDTGPFYGDIYALGIANSALSDARIAEIRNRLLSEVGLGATPDPGGDGDGGTTPALRTQWIVDGDSLDAGGTLGDPATQAWPNQLYNSLSAAEQASIAPPLIIAVSGQTTQDMVNRQANFLFANIDTVNFDELILFVGGGVNDMMMGANWYDYAKPNQINYINAVRAWQAQNNNFPVRIILTSLAPNGKQYGQMTLAEYEIQYKQRNAEAFTDYASQYHADYFSNYSSDQRVLDVTNRAYYNEDEQHPNEGGHAVKAELNKPILLAAKAGIPLAPLPNA